MPLSSCQGCVYASNARFRGLIPWSRTLPYYQLDLDTNEEQDCYVQIWFEAEAMHQQFEYHTRNYRVSLVPFRGDCSIPLKWEIAKKLEAIKINAVAVRQVLFIYAYLQRPR